MKIKIKIFFVLIFLIFSFSSYFLIQNYEKKIVTEEMIIGLISNQIQNEKSKALESQSSNDKQDIPKKYTARFEIYTNGTKRVFTSSMYHNQSDYVYIDKPDPSIVNVNKLNVTWHDFFKTLPFTLNKECLITGTKQTFCNNETKKLHFYLNEQETIDALDQVIQENDFLRVEYKNLN